MRFHGHNCDIWYKGDNEADHRLDRYDYLYKKEQLELWVPHIKEAELKAAKLRVYFNNHGRSKSVRNAFSKEIQHQDQFTLGEFQYTIKPGE